MRHYAAMILIVCGTILALTPAASDYLQGQQIGRYLAAPSERGPVFFRQAIAEEYTVGSWLLGGAMIGLGLLSSCRRPVCADRPTPSDSELLAGGVL